MYKITLRQITKKPQKTKDGFLVSSRLYNMLQFYANFFVDKLNFLLACEEGCDTKPEVPSWEAASMVLFT
jgi:hypothetical protein